MKPTGLLQKMLAHVRDTRGLKLASVEVKNGETSYHLGCLVPTVIYLFLFVLKIANVITWGWWVVLSPLYIPVALMVAYLLIGILYIIVVNIIFD